MFSDDILFGENQTEYRKTGTKQQFYTGFSFHISF